MFVPRSAFLHYLFLNLAAATPSTRIGALHAAVHPPKRTGARVGAAAAASAPRLAVPALGKPACPLSKESREIAERNCFRRRRLPAAFVAPCGVREETLRGSIRLRPRLPFARRGMTTLVAMKPKAEVDGNRQRVDRIASILQDSIQYVGSCHNDRDGDGTAGIMPGAIDLLRRLSSNCADDESADGGTTDVTGACSGSATKDAELEDSGATTNGAGLNHSKITGGEGNQSSLLQSLACAAVSSVESLRQLVQLANQSRKGSRKSSGQAWKALESAVSATFGGTAMSGSGDSGDISHALALLAVGIALSTDSADSSTARMIASAVLPDGPKAGSLQRGTKYRKQEESKTMTTGDGDFGEARDARTIVHSMSRAALLGLLRLAADAMKDESDEISVDLQIVAKLEGGFSVGEFGRTLNVGDGDGELAEAVAGVVDVVFGRFNRTDGGDADDCEYGDGGELVSKDLVAPTFSLVAAARPWDHVRVEKLVTCAAELDLWYSAELLCDAAVASTAQERKKVVMATSFPKDAETEELLTDGPVACQTQDSIGHLASGAIIDITFDYRMYKRADAFASKYYAFGGPERFAQARFLHACDTITKLVKKRQAQIIERQVERVDASVARANKDLGLASPASASASNSDRELRRVDGDNIAVENMSEHIRQFTLRRLRVSNQHAAAARLAKLWGMQYAHDPTKIAQELEERKLLYLQWDDDGCPGNASETAGRQARPLPDVVGEAAELRERFGVLENNVYIGFDCEWHDSIRGVALLQLSSVTDCLLIDVPALTVTKEGCDALRATVGKLFAGPRTSGIKRVIGFGCKDDIRRLRASPCVTEPHWFPQDQRCAYEDLRLLVRESNPQLGGKGGLHFGLSRTCEMFLDKQLDKCEQCSDWLARPLSPEQREYAALDAWVCAAIGSMVFEGKGQFTATGKEEMLLK